MKLAQKELLNKSDDLLVNINDIRISKADLTNNRSNLYTDDLITQEEYDKLPFKDYGGAKIETFRDKSMALIYADKYGASIWDVVKNGHIMYKVVISAPASYVANLEVNKEKIPLYVQEIIAAKRNRILAFKNKLSQKTPRAAEIKANISLLQAQIKKIEDEYDNDSLRKTLFNDIKTIENNLNAVREELKDPNLDDKSLRNLMEVLIENSYNTKGWLYMFNSINEEFTEFKDSIRDLQGPLSKQNDLYHHLMADVYLRYINQKTYRSNFSREDILGAVKDMSSADANFYSIGESHIHLLATVDDLLKDVANKINQAYLKRFSEIDKRKNDLKVYTGKNEEEVSKMFLQYDKDGNWTGNYIGRYSQEFFNERQSRADKAKKDDNWKPYFDWVKKNTTEISYADLKRIEKSNMEDLEKLPEDYKLGVFSKEEIIKQKKMLDKYNEAKQAQIDAMSITGRYSDGEFIEKNGKSIYVNEQKSGNLRLDDEFYLELNNWEQLNSPFLYTKSKNRKEKKGYNYMVNNKPNGNWIDPAYAKIESDKTLYEFYRYMKTTFHENNEYMPYFNNLHENYLPEIELSLLDKIKKAEMADKWGLLTNDLKIALTDDAIKQENGRSVIAGKEIKGIPVHTMENKLLITNKSSNIFEALLEHSKNAFNYKYKAEIEPMVNAASDLLEEIEEVQEIDIDGNPVNKTKLGLPYKSKGKLVEAKAALKHAIDGTVYGDYKESEGRSSKGFTVIDASGKKIDRKFSASNAVDNLNSFTFKLQMSFPNVITPTVNAAMGIVTGMTYAAGGKDISEREMAKGFVTMMSISSLTFGAKANEKLAKKVYAFMSRLNVIGDIKEGTTGKKTFGEVITILQSKAEFFNQGAIMVALLKTQKLKDKNGKQVTVFDAYNEVDGELVWNTELMGEHKEVTSDRIFSEDLNQVNITSLSQYVDTVNKSITGDYKNRMMIKKKAMWRAVMLYKTWIPQAIKHRFGAEKFNKDLLAEGGGRGRTTKGRYLSYGSAKDIAGLDVPFKKVVEIMLKGILSKKAFSELSEVDRVNLMRNLRELEYIGMIWGAIAILQAMFGDDDDDSWALKMAINTLSKTQADMMFFLNPNSTGQVFKNVIPLMSTVGDFVSAVGSVAKTVQGEGIYENGPWKGYSKTGVGVMRIVPGASGSVKMWNYGSRVFTYNNN